MATVEPSHFTKVPFGLFNSFFVTGLIQLENGVQFYFAFRFRASSGFLKLAGGMLMGFVDDAIREL